MVKHSLLHNVVSLGCIISAGKQPDQDIDVHDIEGLKVPMRNSFRLLKILHNPSSVPAVSEFLIIA